MLTNDYKGQNHFLGCLNVLTPLFFQVFLFPNKETEVERLLSVSSNLSLYKSNCYKIILYQ